MAFIQAASAFLPGPATLRRWLSRAFIISILAYLVIVGYLVAEAVMGASKWAPYGVNVPVFIALVIASEVIITLTAVWIFREDAGIWPAAISEGWAMVRSGARWSGLGKILAGAWDVPLVELRLRTPRAIFLGRANRIAALVPLAYALLASADGAPWGLRSSALVDVAITLAVWAFMEVVMVQPESKRAERVPTEYRAPVTTAAVASAGAPARATKRSVYEVRRVTANDVERIEEIERIKWKDQAALRDKIEARLAVYPEGQVAAVHIREVDGVPTKRSVVAWITVMVTDEANLRAARSWEELTANGTIANNNRKGDVIVGVNLSSVTEGATFMLLGEILANVVEQGRAKMVGGGRLNGFVVFNKRREGEGRRAFSAEEYASLREVRGYRLNEERIEGGLPSLSDDQYVKQVDALRFERSLAPLAEDEKPDYVCSNLRGYLGIPGTRIAAVMPEYFPDESSDNYGVLIEWPNPLPALVRRAPVLTSWVAGRIRSEVRSEWEQRRQQVHEKAARRALERVPAYLRREPLATEEAAPQPAPIEVEAPVARE
jgi:hypothetical protein